MGTKRVGRKRAVAAGVLFLLTGGYLRGVRPRLAR
jgi:hypothetical protein